MFQIFIMSANNQAQQPNNGGNNQHNDRPPRRHSPGRTPILRESVHLGYGGEEIMLEQIDSAVRRLLTRPNLQSPYRFNFQWTVNEDETGLNYTVMLGIREPARRS